MELCERSTSGTAEVHREGWWPDHSVGQRMADGLAAHQSCRSSSIPALAPGRAPSATSSRWPVGPPRDWSRGAFARETWSHSKPRTGSRAAITFYAAAFAGCGGRTDRAHLREPRDVVHPAMQCRPKVHVTASRFGHQDFLANLESMRDLPETQLVVLDGTGPAGSIEIRRAARGGCHRFARSVDPDTPALVGWTSGTTASPKGVIHSHQTVCAEIAQLGATSPPTERPGLMANPISHAIGMLGALLIPVDRGKAVHLLDQWDPGEVLDLIDSEDLSAGGGAPYFLTSLLDHPRCGEEHLERLHYQGMGGAPIPRAVMDRATTTRPCHLLHVRIHRATFDHRVHLRRLAREASVDGRATAAGKRDQAR